LKNIAIGVKKATFAVWRIPPFFRVFWTLRGSQGKNFKKYGKTFAYHIDLKVTL
jgi:hypothetical protein